jgi:hypothetical protein
MAGTISFYRPHNDCDKNSLMKITVNGISQLWTAFVADNATEKIDVPDGVYKIFVEFGVQSTKADVNISSSLVNLTVTVDPNTGEMKIEPVDSRAGIMDPIFYFLNNKFIHIEFISNEKINVRLFDTISIEPINYTPHDKTVNEMIISSAELLDDKVIIVLNNSNRDLFEIIQKIPGTHFSVRFDPADTSTSTQRHAHIFDKKNDIYQVNEDGSAHHKSSRGHKIHKKVSDYLRSNGFDIENDRYISFVNIYDYSGNYIIYTLEQKITEEKNDI